MAKVVDITEKLAFDENPILRVKDTELEVNADAETVLRIMGMMSGESTPKVVSDMCDMIFSEESKEKLKGLKLKFNDYVTLVNSAIELVIGADEEEGE